MILLAGNDRLRGQARQRLHQERAAGQRHPVAQFQGGILGFDRDGLLKQHGSRIRAFIHHHRGDAGFRVPMDERPLDRGGAPVRG